MRPRLLLLLVPLKRCCSSSAVAAAKLPGEVRVRFAPSPTGELHLGGYRTALYNFLFARRNRGRLILRVEDTDRSRLVPGAEERLAESLRWGGIEADESPWAGGPAGPYRQSERLGMYAEAADSLVESGAAYRCFCTEKRLDLLRRENVRCRTPNRYDGRCGRLSREEVQHKLQQGLPHVVRLRLNPTPDPFDDLILGPVAHDVSAEGDPVILKSDGFPTYHLASVVDDHHMGVTHVLRGSEWSVSTPKHLELYRALGWKPPLFAHLPLLMNEEGLKLSKRQGDADLGEMRRRGFYPTAVLNYATLVGGGFRDRTGDLMDMDELSERFDLGLVSNSPARVDPERLASLNRTVLKEKLASTPEEVVGELRGRLREGGFDDGDFGDGHLLKVLTWSQDRINATSDLVGEEFAFLWRAAPAELTPPAGMTEEVLSALADEMAGALSSEPTSKEASDAVRRFYKRNKLKFSAAMKFLRRVLIGSDEGPPVGEIVEIFGREEAVRRIRRAVGVLAKKSRDDNAAAG